MTSKTVMVYCNDTYETPELIASVVLPPETPAVQEGFDREQAQSLYDRLYALALIPPYTREFRLQFLANGIPTAHQRWDVDQDTQSSAGVLPPTSFLYPMAKVPTLTF